ARQQDERRSLRREIAEERSPPRVYEDIARGIEQHMSEGTDTWLLTAAPQELADVIAQGLGMTGAMGTVSELDDAGVYTGQLAGPLLHGPEKAKAVARLEQERDLDLSISDEYSDSKNDLPLLES